MYAIDTIDMLDDDVATTCSTLSRSAIAREIGTLTCSSITSGLAPGTAVTTVVCGNESDGISSCLSCVIENTPKPAIRIVMSATNVRLARLKRASRNKKHHRTVEGLGQATLPNMVSATQSLV